MPWLCPLIVWAVLLRLPLTGHAPISQDHTVHLFGAWQLMEHLLPSGITGWSDLYFALLIPLLPAIKRDLDLSFAEVGLLRSIFSGASGVLQIPAGFAAEGVGEFWMLIGGNVWVAIGLIGMALSPFFALLLGVTLVAGLGGGAQHPLASSMVSRAYDDKGRSTAVGTNRSSGIFC